MLSLPVDFVVHTFPFSCISFPFNLYSLSFSLFHFLSLSLSLSSFVQGFHFELIEDLQRTVYTWSTISSQSGALTNLHQLPHLPYHSENRHHAHFSSANQLLSAHFGFLFFTVRGLPVTPSSPATNRKGSESASTRCHEQQIINCFKSLCFCTITIDRYQAWPFLK